MHAQVWHDPRQSHCGWQQNFHHYSLAKLTRQPNHRNAEVQIAILTERINGLSEHFAKNKKDNHSRRGLLTMVNNRKTHLIYVQRENPKKYAKY